jgi:hypothetical protein
MQIYSRSEKAACMPAKIATSLFFYRFDHDPRWSETGDRYIVKLFRDHVFHSVDENGRPVVDLSHILTNLNKLDAGVEEKIMLTSRDEISCLVVSYREVSIPRVLSLRTRRSVFDLSQFF